MIDCRYHAPLGNVGSVTRTERGIVLDVGDEKFRADVILPGVLRLKISQAGRFDESPTFAASFDAPETPRFEVEDGPEEVVLETDAMRLHVSKRPFALDAYRKDGSLIVRDYRDDAGVSRGYLQLNDSFVITRSISPRDAIYGLGEKTGAFNRRGRNFVLWNTDILHPDVLVRNRLHETDTRLTGRSTRFDPYYTSIPFFYHCRPDVKSASVTGFFVDNGYKASFEFLPSNLYRYSFGGGQYTEYVFAGPTMQKVLSDYTFITGRMPLPPIWAVGHHQCRFHDYTQEKILDVGSQYRARDIPCDVLWLDIGHMDGYRVFTWDSTKFPDASSMALAMTEQKFRLVTIVDPGVKIDPSYHVFEEGRARNLFCKTDSGKLYVGQVWPGRTAFPDFVKPEARAWWASLNARHIASGIAGIWNDMNEPATGDIEPFAMRFDRDGQNHSHERYHNQFALLMAMATRDGLLDARPNLRTFILSRAGFAGIQRYAAQWLGDNYSDWEHLQMSIPMALGMGISGQPFIGADIPGFCATPSAELAVRWIQCGALTPFCRYHNHTGEPDQYPWSFGPDVEKLCRAALALRYRLLPYIYSAFCRASETGDPIQRPLAYDFLHDPNAREIDDAYLLGEALLVAPVCEAGRTSRQVYLPEGTWIDWHTDERHAGGQLITARAPIDRIPLFGRGGYVIPAYDTVPRSTMGHFPELIVLHVFVPDQDGDFDSFLQEDDGLSLDHRHGAYLRTEFRLSRRGLALSITAKATGDGFTEFCRSSLRLVFHGFNGSECVLDGRTLRVEDGSVQFENSGRDFFLTLALKEHAHPRSLHAREALQESIAPRNDR
jgi:alpha-glucosidase